MLERTRAYSPRLRRKVAVLAVASCFSAYSYANPTVPTVVSGSASFQDTGKTLAITSSPGAIINWQAFSIQADEVTRFIQQNAASSVLNRVTGNLSSSILGQLLSNGKVFLINPAGIFVGNGAVIDTAGFVASSLNLSNADFLAGKFKFTDQIGAGRIVNQGTIQTPAGGQIYLIAPNVENDGVITSPNGQVILAAGKTVELVQAGSPFVHVELTAPDNQAVNVGQIVAAAGSVGIYGTTIRNSGTVSANSAQVDASGKIVFKVTKDITLASTSAITANGPTGGSVTVQAEGGTLLADGTIEAKGSSGTGGTVQLFGNQVGLINSASVNASGNTGGGTIQIGGDFHGANPDVQDAQRAYVGSGVTLSADAVTNGDGGKVVVWADGDTRFFGSISARGGELGGNGGSVEVSGKQQLVFAGTVDTRAPQGTTGTLLLDPDDITIGSGNGYSGTTNLSATQLWATADDPGAQTIGDAFISNLLGLTSIELQATNSITATNGAGVAVSWSTSKSLTLTAGTNISLNDASFTGTSGALNFNYGGTLDLGSSTLNVAAINATGTTVNSTLQAHNQPNTWTILGANSGVLVNGNII